MTPVERSFLEAVMAGFQSGASVSVEQLVRLARPAFPLADAELVQLALAELLTQGRIERLWSGSFVRYRRLARPAPPAAMETA